MTSAYEKITDRIIAQLEKGVVPWRKPWKVVAPKNLVTGKTYRGINVLLLGIQGFECEYWATFRQINKAGGSVKKGEKGTPVVYTNWFEVEDDVTGKTKMVPFLKQYFVFNLEQIDGIGYEKPQRKEFDGDTKAFDELWSAMPSKPGVTNHSQDRAFYSSLLDLIRLPGVEKFDSQEEYYCTLYHELVHSTGHKSRLSRVGVVNSDGFGKERYSQEELVAEIGAAFMCGMLGIEDKTLDNSAAYVSSWLKKLKNDKRLVFFAASQAQKAVDYITGSERR